MSDWNRKHKQTAFYLWHRHHIKPKAKTPASLWHMAPGISGYVNSVIIFCAKATPVESAVQRGPR